MIDVMTASRRFAELHLQADRLISKIVCYSKDSDELIKLLEVTREVDGIRTGDPSEYFPYKYQAGGFIPYKSQVYVISPDEYRRVKKGELPFPAEWGSLKEGRLLYDKRKGGWIE